MHAIDKNSFFVTSILVLKSEMIAQNSLLFTNNENDWEGNSFTLANLRGVQIFNQTCQKGVLDNGLC